MVGERAVVKRGEKEGSTFAPERVQKVRQGEDQTEDEKFPRSYGKGVVTTVKTVGKNLKKS